MIQAGDIFAPQVFRLPWLPCGRRRQNAETGDMKRSTTTPSVLMSSGQIQQQLPHLFQNGADLILIGRIKLCEFCQPSVIVDRDVSITKRDHAGFAHLAQHTIDVYRA